MNATCDRCGGYMIANDEERYCVVCSHRDYTHRAFRPLFFGVIVHRQGARNIEESQMHAWSLDMCTVHPRGEIHLDIEYWLHRQNGAIVAEVMDCLGWPYQRWARPTSIRYARVVGRAFASQVGWRLMGLDAAIEAGRPHTNVNEYQKRQYKRGGYDV